MPVFCPSRFGFSLLPLPPRCLHVVAVAIAVTTAIIVIIAAVLVIVVAHRDNGHKYLRVKQDQSQGIIPQEMVQISKQFAGFAIIYAAVELRLLAAKCAPALATAKGIIPITAATTASSKTATTITNSITLA